MNQTQRVFSILIDDIPFDLHVEGDVMKGQEKVMLDSDDNILSGLSWENQGYEVFQFLKQQQFDSLKSGITEMVRSRMLTAGIPTDTSFRLENYHRYVGDAGHRKMVESFRTFINIEELPIGKEIVLNRVSEICQIPLTLFTKERGEFFFIRLVRPNQATDYNPPHRDVYLDRIRHAVNTFVPLAGCNSLSSLPLIPGSHHWKESSIMRTELHSKVNGISYTVPCVTSTEYGMLLKRPAVEENEILMFSPYLIHGAAVNFNKDVTRVSLEMRFWRKQGKDL